MLFIFYLAMAFCTDWNHIQPMFFIITFMVMVVIGLFGIADIANFSCNPWHSTVFNSVIYSLARFYFFRFVDIIPKELNASFATTPFFIAFYSYFWMFFSVFSSSLNDMLFVFFIIILVHYLSTRFTLRSTLSFHHVEFSKWFYFFANSTSLVHVILQNKMPAASWIKHDTTGRIILTRNTLLDPTYSFYRIISHV